MIKHPKDFENIPLEYKNEIKRIYEEIINTLNDDVLFLMVTGSCARGTVIAGWSDIDLILVLRKNTHFYRKALKKIFSKSCIKVGYTIYSKEDFTNLDVDFKTLFAIYQMQIKVNHFPTICKKNFNVPHVSEEDLKTYGKATLPAITHKIMRIVYDNNISLNNKLFKEITHVMRTVLFLNDRNSQSYYDVFKDYSEIYDLELFDVDKYILNQNFNQLCAFAIKFLDNYYNYKNKIYGGIYNV